MASIEILELTKKFDALTAVNALSLHVKDREFVALLGPSGCGKTTTMNMIAGIEQPTDGRILFDGKDIVKVPPGKRGVGFVFQNYAIFTHMSVYKNLAFGLEVRGAKSADVDRRVKEIAELLDLTSRLNDSAGRLGVNEMQRLGIGRSAITNPAIFLLDEPLSNLDAAFRATMRTELKHLQHQLGQTMVYVTHDQLEAMSMADRIAVMDLGVLQQFGTPLEVYNQPANVFVARFMGSPSMNLLPCTLAQEGDGFGLQFEGDAKLTADEPDLLAQCRAADSRELYFGIRPEDIHVSSSESEANHMRLKQNFVETIGARTILHLEGPGFEAKAIGPNDMVVQDGVNLDVSFRLAGARLFDRATGLAIAAQSSGTD